MAHGQFLEWLTKMNIERTVAHRMMKVAEELPNVATSQHLGTTALHLIATLPEEEKEEQIQRIEDGDTPTVRELQEVKKTQAQQVKRTNFYKLRMRKSSLPRSKSRKRSKEVVPDDYKATQDLNKQLLEKNKELSKTVKGNGRTSEFIEKQLADILAQREEVDKKSAQYDELTRVIEESQGQLNKRAEANLSLQEYHKPTSKGK